ncbi:MAG: putative esterase YcpF (UPF0227 family) [Paraglaciecola sp.]|jgi:predicted esterase YcpF (UPF0227 family)
MKNVIIYLHGFLSSPQSVKAQQTLDFAQMHFPQVECVIPQLPPYPVPTIQLLDQLIDQYQGCRVGFIGSSLGGYLSTYLREKYQGKAVLINPAVQPYTLLADYLGPHVNPYTQEAFTLEDIHTLQLADIDSPVLTCPENYWVLLQTGDETLDYRLAEQKYRQAKLTIEPGGDHSFQNYPRFLVDIFRFLLQE